LSQHTSGPRQAAITSFDSRDIVRLQDGPELRVLSSRFGGPVAASALASPAAGWIPFRKVFSASSSNGSKDEYWTMAFSRMKKTARDRVINRHPTHRDLLHTITTVY